MAPAADLMVPGTIYKRPGHSRSYGQVVRKCEDAHVLILLAVWKDYGCVLILVASTMSSKCWHSRTWPYVSQ